jgi:hypothetical protein
VLLMPSGIFSQYVNTMGRVIIAKTKNLKKRAIMDGLDYIKF